MSVTRLYFRWGHTPLWEADNAGHRQMTGFLQHWIVKGDNGETLTAAGGKELLQKIKDIELAAVKEGKESQVPSPQSQSQVTSPKEFSTSSATEEARLWAKPRDNAAATEANKKQ